MKKRIYDAETMTRELEWEFFNGKDGAIAKITGGGAEKGCAPL